MSNLDPSLANIMRGQMDVGSDNIRHTHHLGRRSDAIEPMGRVHSLEVEPTDDAHETPGSRLDVIKGLFGTAIKNLKGEGYGST